MSFSLPTAPGTVHPAFWRGRSVLLTGHTGFKGAWLALWLQALGARLTGVSLPEPPSVPSLYELALVGEGMAESAACDIRDSSALVGAFDRARPEIVIHMAAQPLVRRSLVAPRATYDTNVIGTIGVLDAVRACPHVRAVVVVTSDKCYENRGEGIPFAESAPLGGEDPYSSSKAAVELLCAAYRASFFASADAPRLATARAGNVIGGGDWGEDRLIPDAVRAAVAGEPLLLRNPDAVRPWQHVLSPLSGYLLLAQALCESSAYARAWNFGPDVADARPVRWVIERLSALLPDGVRWRQDERPHPPEAAYLRLDSSQAHELLGWHPALSLEQALTATAEWYLAWRRGEPDLRALTLGQIGLLRSAVFR